MTLKEVGILIGEKLKQAKTTSGGFYATFSSAELLEKNSSIFASAVAFGDTKKEARKNLAEDISGKIIVINARLSNRREYQMPPIITTR